MKAMVYEQYGPPEVLQLKDVETPTPADNEILIKIHATTVTAGDCELRRFDFPPLFWLPVRIMFGLRKPKIQILGQEFAGVVEAVGRDVTAFQVGDAVFGPAAINMGAHAAYICLPDTAPLALKPDNMSHAQAAGVPTGGLNSLHFLGKVNIQPGEKVLINGAGGSIGTFGVQLAKHSGAEVTAVDSAGKLDMLRSLGADHVIDYKKEDFTRNGETYDVIFDVACKGSVARCIRSLTPRGRYVAATPTVAVMMQGAWLLRTSSKRAITGLADYPVEDLLTLKELIEAGVLKTAIDRQYSLAEMAEAHRYVEMGEKKGCVVILTVAGAEVEGLKG